MKCHICEKDVNGPRGLSSHIKKHGMCSEEYYSKFLKKQGEGICKVPGCSKKTYYIDIKNGYCETCSKKHQYVYNKDKREKTCVEKYGVTHPLKCDLILSRVIKTKIKKYGNTNNSAKVSQSLKNYYKDNKQKWLKKIKAKWGKKTEEDIRTITEKRTKALIKKGTSSGTLLKNGVLEKYGVSNISKTKKWNKKVKEKWKNHTKSDKEKIHRKRKRTIIKKYVTYDAYLKSIKEKREKTCLIKYGVKNPSSSKFISEKISRSRIKGIKKGLYSNFKYSVNFRGKKYRSSWEALFHYLYPNLEYEKTKIKYKDEHNKERTYITDFTDETNKIIYEVKFSLFNNQYKMDAAKEWSKANNYEYKIVDEHWFSKTISVIDFRKIPELSHIVKDFRNRGY